jgi:hypothetical protein
LNGLRGIDQHRRQVLRESAHDLPFRLTDVLATLAEAWRIVGKRRAKLHDRAERAAIARCFNARYTQRKEYIDAGCFEGTLVRKGHAWMCPRCNRVHFPSKCIALTGLHYPACCSTPEGRRVV